MQTTGVMTEEQVKEPGTLLHLSTKRVETIELKDLFLHKEDNGEETHWVFEHKTSRFFIGGSTWQDYGKLLGLPGQAIFKASPSVIASAYQELLLASPELKLALVVIDEPIEGKDEPRSTVTSILREVPKSGIISDRDILVQLMTLQSSGWKIKSITKTFAKTIFHIAKDAVEDGYTIENPTNGGSILVRPVVAFVSKDLTDSLYLMGATKWGVSRLLLAGADPAAAFAETLSRAIGSLQVRVPLFHHLFALELHRTPTVRELVAIARLAKKHQVLGKLLQATKISPVDLDQWQKEVTAWDKEARNLVTVPMNAAGTADVTRFTLAKAVLACMTDRPVLPLQIEEELGKVYIRTLTIIYTEEPTEAPTEEDEPAVSETKSEY